MKKDYVRPSITVIEVEQNLLEDYASANGGLNKEIPSEDMS